MKITAKIFRDLYNNHFEQICRFLGYYAQDKDAIRGVVQDVFVKLWEDRESMDIKHIKTYLYHSAKNRILNYLRDEMNHKTALQMMHKNDLESRRSHDIVDLDELFCYVQLVIEKLPPQCREIYKMSRDSNLTYKEIAEKKGLSVKTVENQMGIALKRIRQELLLFYNRK